MHLNIFSEFSYTMETLIGAGYHNLKIESVDIRVNPKTRESRLFSNIGEFVFKSGSISLRTWARYAALKIFALCGALTFAVGVLLGLRFLYYFFFAGEGLIHVQSLILAAILLLAGFQMFLTGVVADLIATNRSLLEDVLRRVKDLELRGGEREEER